MGGKSHPCTFDGCNSIYNRPYRLQLHMLSAHLNVKLFSCTIDGCNKNYSNRSHLDRHIQSCHSQDNEKFIYRCPVKTCMKTFANKQNLNRHTNRNHAEKKMYLCDECKLEFRKKDQLREHIYVHTGIKAFSCKSCGEKFKTSSQKKRHISRHKSYKCDVCLKEFGLWSQLIKHKREEHLPKEYTCHHCKRTFKTRAYIVKHMKEHYQVNLKQFPCTYENCFREYTSKSNLKSHIRVKHERHKFPCPQCDAILSHKSTLTRHLATHTKEKTQPKPNKTLLTGRKPRRDKGTSQSASIRIVGVTKFITNGNENLSEEDSALSDLDVGIAVDTL